MNRQTTNSKEALLSVFRLDLPSCFLPPTYKDEPWLSAAY